MSKSMKQIDDVGRVLLPLEIRKALELQPKDWMVVTLKADEITMKKYEDSCILCGGQENLIKFRTRYVCKHCKNDLYAIYEN